MNRSVDRLFAFAALLLPLLLAPGAVPVSYKYATPLEVTPPAKEFLGPPPLSTPRGDRLWVPKEVPKSMLTPEELANPAQATPRADKLSIKPAPKPKRDSVIEKLVEILGISVLLAFIAWAFYARLSAKRLSPPRVSLMSVWREMSAQARVARFHCFAALLLPLLLAPGAAPVSYKYATPPEAASPQAVPDRFSTHPKSTPEAAAILPRPDVTLSLVDPAHPALLLINETGLVAKDIDYAIALWNAETLEEMLAVEGQGPGALLPREMFGPVDLIDPGKIGAFPKNGDKLVGNVAVNCRACARGYSYWVYLDWGKSGWFSEIKGIADGDLVVPKGIGGMPAGISPRWSRAALLKKTLVAWVASVEQDSRIPIVPFTLPKGMGVVSPE